MVEDVVWVCGESACVGLVMLLDSCLLVRGRCGSAYLEEVQVAAQGCAGRLVALGRHLADHDDDDANEPRERQQHRRENTRESSCFAHLCGCVVLGIESWC